MICGVVDARSRSAVARASTVDETTAVDGMGSLWVAILFSKADLSVRKTVVRLAFALNDCVI